MTEVAAPHPSQASQHELDSLLARLAAGDRAAFDRAFRLLWDPIHRLCSSLLGSDADAQDAAQDAMQKIFERASDYDPKRPAMPWAMALAGWECRTVLRKRLRRREVAEEGEGFSVDRGAEDEFVQRDLTRAAVAALGELSDLDRETLVSTFWDAVPSASGATLRKRRERALARLQQTFRRLYGLD